jgi:hypothetical protein
MSSPAPCIQTYYQDSSHSFEVENINRMEAKGASIWSEESEMIAHLQSMFWNSSDADVSLSSPNSSTSSCIEPSALPTALFLPFNEKESYDTAPLQNAATDWCFDHQSESFGSIDTAVTGDKRALLMDERRKKSNKKPRIVAPVSNANTLKKFFFPTSTVPTLYFIEHAAVSDICNGAIHIRY